MFETSREITIRNLPMENYYLLSRNDPIFPTIANTEARVGASVYTAIRRSDRGGGGGSQNKVKSQEQGVENVIR